MEVNMKRSYAKKWQIMTVCAILCLFVAGCAAKTFNQRSYKILKTSQSAYDLVTDGIIDLHKKGLIPDKDYKNIEKKADIYAEAHNKAVDAIKAYKMGMSTLDQTNNKLTAVSVALTELLRVAQPYILKLEE